MIYYLLLFLVIYSLYYAYCYFYIFISKKLSGNDLTIRLARNKSVLYTVLKYNDNTESVEKIVRKKINQMIDESNILLTKKIINNKKVYDNNLNKNMSQSERNRYLKQMIRYGDSTDLYKNKYDLINNFQIIIDKNNKKVIIQSDHSIFDGLSIMKVITYIFSELDHEYHVPNFRFIPFYNEYLLAKTLFIMKKMPKPSIDFNPVDLFKTESIIDVKLNKNILKITENIPFISSYVYYMINLLFESTSKTHFNVIIVGALKNKNRYNNTSGILINIKKTDTLEIVNEKIKNNKFMLFSVYFYTSLISKNFKNNNIDVMISSVPGSKDFNDHKYNYDYTYLPYSHYPIYILNVKNKDTCSTSIHISENIDTLKYYKLKNVIEKKNKIISDDHGDQNEIKIFKTLSIS